MPWTADAGVAQLAERDPSKVDVAGSIPVSRSDARDAARGVRTRRIRRLVSAVWPVMGAGSRAAGAATASGERSLRVSARGCPKAALRTGKARGPEFEAAQRRLGSSSASTMRPPRVTMRRASGSEVARMIGRAPPKRRVGVFRETRRSPLGSGPAGAIRAAAAGLRSPSGCSPPASRRIRRRWRGPERIPSGTGR